MLPPKGYPSHRIARPSVMRLGPRIGDYRHGAEIVGLVRSFLVRFPELDRRDFELDLLPSAAGVLGLADIRRNPPRIRLWRARPSNPDLTYVIPHELAHLMQHPLGPWPGGERAADLYAIARAGDRFRVPPGYLRVPAAARDGWPRMADRAHRLAQEALQRRSRGLRTYIVWWEAGLRDALQSRKS